MSHSTYRVPVNKPLPNQCATFEKQAVTLCLLRFWTCGQFHCQLKGWLNGFWLNGLWHFFLVRKKLSCDHMKVNSFWEHHSTEIFFEENHPTKGLFIVLYILSKDKRSILTSKMTHFSFKAAVVFSWKRWFMSIIRSIPKTCFVVLQWYMRSKIKIGMIHWSLHCRKGNETPVK